MLIYGFDDRLLPWAAERIGIERFRDDARAIGIACGDQLRGVVVYDTFSACDCHMHVASDRSRRWLTREFLVHAFSYPFVQVGLRRVTGIVAASNEDAIRFDKKLGFLPEGFCPKALPNDDIVIMGLTRDRCRFIPLEYRHA